MFLNCPIFFKQTSFSPGKPKLYYNTNTKACSVYSAYYFQQKILYKDETIFIPGRLDLWNLNKDTEVASASAVIENGAALNRITWTQSGLHVAAGETSIEDYIEGVAYNRPPLVVLWYS